ncbi:MAG: DUF1579 domain-containing protein [Chthoniobacterales bacterium]
MKVRQFLPSVLLATVLTAGPAFAQSASSPAAKTTSTTTTAAAAASSDQPNEAEMMAQMMELAKPNENHKLLADLAGNWTYTTKMWMDPDPNAKPMESKGTATRKAIMGGRYFVAEAKSKMAMPGPDGKMQDFDFAGTSFEGYDNVKKKFVSTWVDNMGTGILMSEGTYDPASKTFTYAAEGEMVPGQKMQIREIIKVVDKDHHIFEWYDTSRGTEAKTMEISYTRAK